MRDSSRVRRRGLGSMLMTPVVLGALAACGPAEDSGFDKVTHRVQGDIPAPAAPEPPPVVAGIGGPAAGARLVATNLPAGVTQEMVDQGQQSFGTVCSACHGANGTGTPAGPALNDNEWLNVTGQYPEIVTVINTGVPNPKQFPGAMPPKGGGNFTDEQVRAIAAYVYALSHQGGA